MGNAIHPNEAFSRDFWARRDGAIDPAKIAHEACVVASKTKFPGTDVALADLKGQAALEALDDVSVIDQRRIADDRMYAANKETALLAIIAKLTKCANETSLGYIRRDTLIPALRVFRDSDDRLAHISDESLTEMAEQIQSVIALSVNTSKALKEQPLATRRGDVATQVPGRR